MVVLFYLGAAVAFLTLIFVGAMFVMMLAHRTRGN
jgi:hypothetical protein